MKIVSQSQADTTRSPRPGETHGNQYYFVTQEKFKELIDEKAFIEYAQYSGNFYGTSFMTVKSVEDQGKRCILDIEAQVQKTTSISLFDLQKHLPRYSFLSGYATDQTDQTKPNLSLYFASQPFCAP
jgi:guanylate kinase